MEASPLLILLSAGIYTTAISSHYRQHFMTKEIMTWAEAQSYCRQTYTDLVTVHNQAEAEGVGKKPGESIRWIGLSRRTGELKWSNGYIVNYEKYVLEDGRRKPYCNSMSASGSWDSVDCTEKKFFMCSNIGEYTLIKKRRSWCEAQTYCRLHHTDLVSINSDTENDDVLQKGGKAETFWIGLMHLGWEWSDGACSTYANWETDHPRSDKDCVYIFENDEGSNDNGKMNTQSCSGHAAAICYKDQIHLIKQTKTWEGALDYCNRYYDGLLRIETPHDQLRLEAELKKEGVSGPVWLGLRQSRLFGFWIWTNGLNVGWSNWEGGSQPEQPLSHICGAMATSGPAKFKWSDQHCLSESYFLCEGEER